MNLTLISDALLFWKQISIGAWVGSDIFFLALLIPSMRMLQGEFKVNAYNRVFTLGKSYFRFWGLSTVLSILVLMFPWLFTQTGSILVMPSIVNLLSFLLFFLAYVVGEIYIFPYMSRYSSISGALDNKEKGNGIPHLMIMEEHLSEALLLQVILLFWDIMFVFYISLNIHLP